ncbi:MAG: DUF4907 domain-containing protein [Algibacter sp.]
MKKKYVIIFILLSLIIGGSLYINHAIKNDSNNLEVIVFKIENGFGYRIEFDNKTLIKQEVIPSIQHNQAFCSYKDAEKVGLFVRDKLYNKENPKVTSLDLNTLDIQMNCLK